MPDITLEKEFIITNSNGDRIRIILINNKIRLTDSFGCSFDIPIEFSQFLLDVIESLNA